MNKAEQINSLSECIFSEYTIECEKCKKIEGSVLTNELSFAAKLYEKGWRFSGGNATCPTCIKSIKKLVKIIDSGSSAKERKAYHKNLATNYELSKGRNK